MPQRASPQQSGDASWSPSPLQTGDVPWNLSGREESPKFERLSLAVGAAEVDIERAIPRSASIAPGRGTQQSVAQPWKTTLPASATLQTGADAGPLQQTSAADAAASGGHPDDAGDANSAVKRSPKRKVWTFVACNTNSGATGETILNLKPMRRADVWLWQERKYDSSRCSDARGRLKTVGRAAFLAPALPGANGSWSSGVGVVTVARVGQSSPKLSPTSH